MSAKFPIWIGVIFVVSFSILGISYCGLKKVHNLEALEKSIEEEFPEVEHISTAALAALMENGDDVLLIDCRESEEYGVSRIPGAVNLVSVREVRAALAEPEAGPSKKIAVYCSVGYRSAKLADALSRDGFENVANVRGSIFAWANEDRPLENPDGAKAEKVHPFNEFWGRLLKENRRLR